MYAILSFPLKSHDIQVLQKKQKTSDFNFKNDSFNRADAETTTRLSMGIVG